MCNHSQSTTWYNRLFARFYDPFMRRFEQDFLLEKRRHLLQSIQGTILEIGCGTGINFTLYPAGTQVIACDPSAPMLGYAYERLEQEKANIKAAIELVHAGMGDAALESYVPEGGFDAIVCTLVLCTVPDQRAAIETIKKWLKPGGNLYVLEHIQAHSSLGKFFFNLFNPLQKRFAEGCHLNRTTDQNLKNQGFQPNWETYFSKGLPLYAAILHLKN
ncbi:MAG: class I SAM-dependent methyltransferase [Saprospiraceae bacterium]